MNLNLEGIYHGEDQELDIKPTFHSSRSLHDDRKHYRELLPVKPEQIDAASSINDDISSEMSTLVSRIESLEQKSAVVEAQWPDDGSSDDDCQLSMAINDALQQLINDMARKLEKALDANKEKQKSLMARQAALREAVAAKKKTPIMQYLPPYFKDEHNMCAPLSDEARHKLAVTEFDPLASVEKKWNAAELTRFKTYVRRAMVDVYIGPLVRKRDELFENVRAAGQDADKQLVQQWRDEWDVAVRKIAFQSQMSLEDLCASVDANDVDWAKIATIDFGGQRSPYSLRLKWFNEVSPRWNQAVWSKEEAARLKEYVEGEKFLSWPVVAEKLGTNRTPWQCFEKYKSEVYQESREWTEEEDEKLITLCNIIKINGQIQWDKVTYYMPGRTRAQVRVRYQRTLDKNVKHGKWSDQEDLLLMCAVNRFGATMWSKIAKSVPGRTDTQCRERWTSVLDKRTFSREWTLEDDEKLIYLVTRLGRHQWAKFTNFLDRTGDHCRNRFISMLGTKIMSSVTGDLKRDPESMTDYEMRQTMKKLKINRIYRKYNNMMATIDGQGADDAADAAAAAADGVDRLMDVVISKEKKPRKGIEKPMIINSKRQLPDDLKADIMAGIEEIAERHRRKEPVAMDQLLANIPVEDSDIEYFWKRRMQQKAQKDKKKAMMGDSYKKGRKLQLRNSFKEDPELKTRHDEVVESTALSESEKVTEMYDLLIDSVTRLDAHEFIQDFQKYWQDTGNTIANEVAREILTRNLDADVEKLQKGEKLDFSSTIPPSWANLDLYLQLQKCRPLLTRSAIDLFHRLDSSIDHPSHASDNHPMIPIDVGTSLFVRLHSEVTESAEYCRLKALLRNILLEPMIFEDACMSGEEYVFDCKKAMLTGARLQEERDLTDGTRRLRLPGRRRAAAQPSTTLMSDGQRLIPEGGTSRGAAAAAAKTARGERVPAGTDRLEEEEETTEEQIPPETTRKRRKPGGKEEEEGVKKKPKTSSSTCSRPVTALDPSISPRVTRSRNSSGGHNLRSRAGEDDENSDLEVEV